MTSAPAYLTRNSHDVYYFIARTPSDFRRRLPSLPRHYRKSLKTKYKKDALKQSRRLKTMMEKLEHRYFDTPEQFGKAMTLLMSEAQYTGQNFEQIEKDFLSGLDEYDENLLQYARNYEEATHTQMDMLVEKKALALLQTLLVNQNLTTATTPPVSGYRALTIAELIEKFLSERGLTISPSTLNRDYRPKLELFAEIIGSSIQAHELSKEHIVRFKEALLTLPAHKAKKAAYRNKSVSELLSMHIPETDRMSDNTLKSYFTTISGFLNWCERNDACVSNLNTPLHKVVKKKIQDNKERDAFDDNDLKKIFNSKQYVNGAHKKPSQHWIPLIALFTGARSNEICQLETDDIYNINNIPVIHIAKDGKRKKNASSERLIPVHKQLIELGFLDYIEYCRKIKIARLFPELKENDKGYSSLYSKWFNGTYLNQHNCNIKNKDNKKDFHSFRHTVATRLNSLASVKEHHISQLLGHKPGDGSMTTQRYTKDSDIKELKKVINKLVYTCIDFKLIKTHVWKRYITN